MGRSPVDTRGGVAASSNGSFSCMETLVIVLRSTRVSAAYDNEGAFSTQVGGNRGSPMRGRTKVVQSSQRTDAEEHDSGQGSRLGVAHLGDRSLVHVRPATYLRRWKR